MTSEFKSFHQHQFRRPVWIYSHHCEYVDDTALAISQCQIGWKIESGIPKKVRQNLPITIIKMEWNGKIEIFLHVLQTLVWINYGRRSTEAIAEADPVKNPPIPFSGRMTKRHFRTTEWQFRMTTEIAISNTMIIMSNFRPQNDIKTLAHKPYGLGIRYFEHHQQHILVKFQPQNFMSSI